MFPDPQGVSVNSLKRGTNNRKGFKTRHKGRTAQNQHLLLSKRRALTLRRLVSLLSDISPCHAFIFLLWDRLLPRCFWSPSRRVKGTTKHEFWQKAKAFFFFVGGRKQMDKYAVFQRCVELFLYFFFFWINDKKPLLIESSLKDEPKGHSPARSLWSFLHKWQASAYC